MQNFDLTRRQFLAGGAAGVLCATAGCENKQQAARIAGGISAAGTILSFVPEPDVVILSGLLRLVAAGVNLFLLIQPQNENREPEFKQVPFEKQPDQKVPQDEVRVVGQGNRGEDVTAKIVVESEDVKQRIGGSLGGLPYTVFHYRCPKKRTSRPLSINEMRLLQLRAKFLNIETSKPKPIGGKRYVIEYGGSDEWQDRWFVSRAEAELWKQKWLKDAGFEINII